MCYVNLDGSINDVNWLVDSQGEEQVFDMNGVQLLTEVRR
jgi:hypothetical protein